VSHIDLVISSFRESLKLKKVIGLIYLVQLLLAMIVAIVAGSFINKLAHTVSIHVLLSDFNYQIIEDLKISAQSNWTMIAKVAFVVALLYMVISLFLHSGLLYCIYQSSTVCYKKFYNWCQELLSAVLFSCGVLSDPEHIVDDIDMVSLSVLSLLYDRTLGGRIHDCMVNTHIGNYLLHWYCISICMVGTDTILYDLSEPLELFSI